MFEAQVCPFPGCRSLTVELDDYLLVVNEVTRDSSSGECFCSSRGLGHFAELPMTFSVCFSDVSHRRMTTMVSAETNSCL